MPVYIDYDPMFREARKAYAGFRTAYELVKRAERENKPINKTTRSLVQMFFHDMFKTHPDIRETMPGVNDELAEMIKKGFLELTGEEISPFDPATERHYWDNLLSKAKAG
jgi:hypothetical protein